MDEPQVFHKRPVTTEAMLYTGQNGDAISGWVGFMSAYADTSEASDGTRMVLETPNGPTKLRPGEWVAKDVLGRFYPIDPQVFAQTHADGPGHEYPYRDGEVLVLGPQVFVGTREDGVRVINWKGENFEEQERIAKLQEALGLARSIIRSGESMSEQAETIFRAAMGTRIGREPAPRDAAEELHKRVEFLQQRGYRKVVGTGGRDWELDHSGTPRVTKDEALAEAGYFGRSKYAPINVCGAVTDGGAGEQWCAQQPRHSGPHKLA